MAMLNNQMLFHECSILFLRGFQCVFFQPLLWTVTDAGSLQTHSWWTLIGWKLFDCACKCWHQAVPWDPIPHVSTYPHMFHMKFLLGNCITIDFSGCVGYLGSYWKWDTHQSIFTEMKHSHKGLQLTICWLVVWNIFYFSIYCTGNNHPNWLIFFRGVGKPPTRYGIPSKINPRHELAAPQISWCRGIASGFIVWYEMRDSINIINLYP